MRETFVTVLMLLGVGAAASAQSPPSPLFAAMTTDEYFAETYTERPRGNASFVFFVGEPIKLALTIANRGPEDRELRMAGKAAADVFTFETTGDERVLPVALSIGDGVWRGRGGETFVVNPAEPIRLSVLERVVWRAAVLDQLPPGQYLIRLAISATDGDGRRIIPGTSMFRFEVRPGSDDAQVEIVRRQALRYFVLGEPSELERASAAVDELLRIHPRSAEAFIIRGEIARSRGLEALANANFERAAEILTKNQDTRLLKFKTPKELDDMRRSVSSRVRKQP